MQKRPSLLKTGLRAGLVGLFVLAALPVAAQPGTTRVMVDRERPLTTAFDPDDARITVNKMVDSLLQSPRIVRLNQQGIYPVVDVTSVENRTTQVIDTVSLTDSIRTKLIRSGLFDFKDRSTAVDDIEIMDEENTLGLVNPNEAVQAGEQAATRYTLYGAIVEMTTQQGRVTDTYYKITMNLKDLQSGTIIWADEQELRKQSVAPRVRW